MKTYFVCSDIHSFYDEWICALAKQDFDKYNPDHIVIICGDLFDRGPDAKKCFEFARDLYEQSRLMYIKGNHEDLLEQLMFDVSKKFSIKYHHVTNKTVDTIAQICGVSEIEIMYSLYDVDNIVEKMQPLMEFIKEAAIDYYELNNWIFCHGWIPVTRDHKDLIVSEEWKQGDWNQARWHNGMQCWNVGAYIPDKCIVCGHWHTSWGHSHIARTHKEWEPKERTCFLPFNRPGLLAIDSCVAYSKFLNCVRIQEDEYASL